MGSQRFGIDQPEVGHVLGQDLLDLEVLGPSLVLVEQLSGFVDTAEQKARADQIAAGTNGVTAVRNNISVKSATAP